MSSILTKREKEIFEMFKYSHQARIITSNTDDGRREGTSHSVENTLGDDFQHHEELGVSIDA